MSDYLNFSIQTKDQIKTWVLRKLGYPLIKVEISEEQLDQCINDSVEEFTKYVVQEVDYIAKDLTTYDATSGFSLPSNVLSVFALEESNIASGSQSSVNTLFSVQNAMWNAGLFPDFASGAGGGWITYELAMEYVDMIKKWCGSGFHFEYNERNKKLTLYPDPTKMSATGWVCFGTRTIREESYQYGEVWVKKMTLALAKQIIGNVRIKYSGTHLLGGGTINTDLKEEGRNEEEALRKEIFETFRYTTFFIG